MWRKRSPLLQHIQHWENDLRSFSPFQFTLILLKCQKCCERDIYTGWLKIFSAVILIYENKLTLKTKKKNKKQKNNVFGDCCRMTKPAVAYFNSSWHFRYWSNNIDEATLSQWNCMPTFIGILLIMIRDVMLIMQQLIVRSYFLCLVTTVLWALSVDSTWLRQLSEQINRCW